MPKPKILFFLICAALIVNCNDIHQVMPSVPVNVILHTDTDLANLGIGNTIVCPKAGGYLGIIIFRNGYDEYYAFERTCTNFPNDTSAVVAEKGDVIAKCPKCGSTFIFTANGALVSTGPARFPLKQYRTYLDPSKRLYISN